MRIVLGVAVVVGEALVAAAWLTSGNAAIVIIVQVLVLTLLAVLLLGIRVVRLRSEHLHEVSVRTAAQERARIAEEMHDALGHELSLIAMQAGALQLTHPESADRSAEIRQGAERATLALREIVAVSPVASEGHAAPVDTDLAEILARSTVAGLVTDQQIGGLDDLPQLVRDTVTRVVREALTNAGRYGSGPAGVTVRRDDVGVLVEVANPVAGVRRSGGDGPGSGLTQLQRRVTLLGGTFESWRTTDQFCVRARIPVRPVVTPSPSSPAPGSRSLRRRWLLTVVGPMVLVATVVGGYYAWAVHDAAADQATIAQVHPGMTEAAALSILPTRDAPVRFSSSRSPEGADRCRYVTNGNFPLGYATWRVCFGGGVVIGIDDIR